MRLKLFSSKAGNRKPHLDDLENEVNAWLEAHPNVTIENTHEVSHPNMAWSHLTLAVWYSE